MQENPATLALVALMVGVVGTASVAIRGEETRRIVTKSPCLVAPDGKACADIRQDVARAEPIRNPCVSYQRVTRTRGRACPKDFIDLSQRPEGQATSKEVHGSGAGATGGPAPASTGGHQQSPTGGVDPSHGKGTSGGTKKPSKSQEPSPEAESPPASADTGTDTAPVETAPEQPEPGGSSTPEPGLIGNPGGIVGELVCQVNELGVRVCTEPG